MKFLYDSQWSCLQAPAPYLAGLRMILWVLRMPWDTTLYAVSVPRRKARCDIRIVPRSVSRSVRHAVTLDKHTLSIRVAPIVGAKHDHDQRRQIEKGHFGHGVAFIFRERAEGRQILPHFFPPGASPLKALAENLSQLIDCAANVKLLHQGDTAGCMPTGRPPKRTSPLQET